MTKLKILIHPHDHKKEKDWRKIFKFLEKNLDFDKIENFLDLGAGTGNLGCFALNKNSNTKVVCEDINREYLDLIQKRDSRIKVLQHNINQNLPFSDNSFDLVSCVGTLHYSYAKDSETIIQEMVRVSNKYILIDCFSKYSPWVLVEKILHPKYNPRRGTFTEMKKIFQKNDLNILNKFGLRTPLPNILPFSGKTVLFLLKIKN